MVRLPYCSHPCVCDVTHGIGFIPILCDCDVRFQYVSIQIAVALCEQFHKIACKKRSRIQKEYHRLNEPWISKIYMLRVLVAEQIEWKEKMYHYIQEQSYPYPYRKISICQDRKRNPHFYISVLKICYFLVCFTITFILRRSSGDSDFFNDTENSTSNSQNTKLRETIYSDYESSNYN